jgi:twinkle protein
VKTFGDFRIEVPAGKGGEVDVICPECSPTRKKKTARCLSVNVEKGVWNCAHCAWTGTLKDGARRGEVEHWRKPAYVRPLSRDIGEVIDPGVVGWFADRGIPQGVIRRNRVSAQTVYMPQREEHVKAVCFPYYRDDELINCKYRDREKNFRMEAGAERILYGLNDIASTTIICEGEVDKLSIEAAGFENCVSVPDGAPAINAKNYASKFSFLDDERLVAVTQWIIAVDNDEPGTRLEQELSRRFGIENCKRVVWPEGCKDANDVLVKHGAAKLKACIDGAQEFPISGVIYIRQLKREIDLLYAQGESRGLSTGWREFDKFYTVKPGEFTVVTGTPGSGKSNWLDALLVNLSKMHHWVVPIFSPENQPLAAHASRLMEKFIREPFRRGPTPRMSPARKDEAVEWCDFYFPMILPEEEADWTLENIFKIAKALVRRHGIKGIVIDPWNEIEHVRPSHLNESEYVGLSLKKVRQFARRMDIHVWLVAHPAKLYRNKEGQYPIPSLYDISGSANFYNKVDNGIVVWRDKNDPNAPVEVHVQKIRFRDTGQLGTASFRYSKVLADYEELIGPQPVEPHNESMFEQPTHWNDR